MADALYKAATRLAVVTFALMAAFMIWAFAQAGTLGMYRWGYSMPILTLCALGVSPLIIALAARSLRTAAGRFSHVLAVLTMITALLGIFVVLGVGLYIFSNAYGPRASSARQAIIDPAAGLPIRNGPDGQQTLRVALSSDPHFGRAVSNAAATSDILRLSQAEYEAGRLDAFFDLGDTVEMGMNAANWKLALESIHRDAPTLPFIALLGNHDALIGGTARWTAAFATGSGGTPKGGLSASSWRMDAGRVHFIALDMLWGPEGFGPARRAWLRHQMESIPATDFIVVLTHCFFYSSGYIDEDTGKPWYDHEAMLREIAPILSGRADLVVSGHNHYMEWLEAGGTAWAVVGAMGGKPDPVPTYVSPKSVWFSQGRFGRLVLELRPEGLACEFQDQAGAPLFQRTLKKPL
ncbi:MAG TPA: metallophosphoesterase [bacterium]|nr:metallophosphoesterase [bacterium]